MVIFLSFIQKLLKGIQFFRNTKEHPIYYLFYFHCVHGITGLYAMERYNEEGCVWKYSYEWKIIYPKKGKHLKHISAWGNELHEDEETRKEFIVAFTPHHHHIPGYRRARKENWDVWTLEETFEFVAYYIQSGKEYKP
ncbi:hypothetical protein [Ureibacillus thermophilus]|uniref:Uncharacterized protein n=1 Tax=Ureibacillus thermophilus TaxID=367743 RepID=A0A4P6URM0_9BACL|nr:hypothetical protein [Ureibacillus thermophilus]QBK25155.1 hypothetical protein DKZ56_04360 [Ureibacillus thermophilus]